MKTTGRIACLVLSSVCVFCGCSDASRPTVWTGDEKAISELMDNWNDADKKSPEQISNFFVKQAIPTTAQLKQTKEYVYTQAAYPKVSGTTATLSVTLTPHKPPATPTTVDWSFEKEGENWKIKTAPLP